LNCLLVSLTAISWVAVVGLATWRNWWGWGWGWRSWAWALKWEAWVNLLDTWAAGAELGAEAFDTGRNSSLALGDTLGKALGTLEASGKSAFA
jgi:hypothetical protein